MKSKLFDTTEGGSAGRACDRSASRANAYMWPPIVLALIVGTGADASAQTKIDLRTQAKSVDFSAATSTKPSKAGTVFPSACSVGETFLKTDAAPTQNFYVCTTGGVWSLQGAVIPSVTGFANMVLATDGTALMWRALGGDASGAPGSLTVSKLQGRPLSGAAPAGGQALVWNSTSLQWEPQSVAGGVSGISSFVLTGDLGGTLASASVSGIRSRNVSATPPTIGQVLTWNPGTNQWEPQSLSSGGGSGSYSSSFVAQTTVTIPGAVHLLGTANLIVGCYDTTTVPNLRVQANSVSVNPTNYDVSVTFSMVQTGRCVVAAGGSGSGGGGGGASMASQLGDFNSTWTSATVLTVGPNCSTGTPCNVRVGSNVYRYVNGTAVTVTGGTGTAYIYVDPNGVLTVGHNVTLSCVSPCVAVPGVTSFPVNSIPLFTWTATGGTWDPAGGLDKRATLSTRVLGAGTGIATLDTGSSTSISVDTAVVPTYLTAAAALTFGSIANASCASDKTFALPGAAVGDAVAPGWPSGIENGLIGSMRVSAANTITVRLCNFSGGALSPANATYRGTVVRNF